MPKIIQLKDETGADAYPLTGANMVDGLANVAKTGSYDDLSNKPTIPTVPTISTDIEADGASDVKTASPKAVKTFVEGKGYGTYSKPSGGIPASDLASGVIPTVPVISTDIEADKTSDTKTASAKAVYTQVSQLRSELEGGETTVTDADVTSVAGRWVNDNGVIGTATSGALHRAEVIDLTGIVSFSLTTDMSWASENAAYLCDDSGNIIETIPRLVPGDPTVITDKAVPDGVTKIYINFATTFELKKKSLGIEEKFDNKLQSLEVDVEEQIVTEVARGTGEAINQYQEQYGARDIVDNTSPIELSEDDFVLGNLNGDTGAEISATNVVRSSFIEVVPGAGFTFQTSNSYRCDIFMYDADKAFITHFGWQTGTYTNTLEERASYIRIVLASPSGTSTAPVWEDAALSVTIVKKYVPTRAVGKDEVRGVVEGYFDIELPILAPSPQLPANDSQEADFNAETVTSADIHNALDALINLISSPSSGTTNSPKFLTKYEVSGIDASGVYPIRTYAMGLRNRYAWRFANELYAWKDGSDNIVFLDSCSPRVGDTIYSDSARTDSGKTVVSYNSGTGTMVDSGSTSYTRSEVDNATADMFWTRRATSKYDTTATILTAYNRADISLGSATYVDATHLSLGGKTYTRSECFDYHSEQKGTIFIWGNEHGPTSDPLEPSIILYRLAKDLCGGCRNNPFLMFIKQYFKIVFIPCANPWGCQYPRVSGRVNSNGVNINRNYDTPGWPVVADTDKGSYAGDQNETQYIMNMCKRFAPDISIDIHCLGFGNDLAEGLMYLSETAIPDDAAYLRTQNVMSGLGFLFGQRGNPMPESGSHGSEWLDYHDMIGGVFEMNAGAYSLSHIYDGRQHTPSVMEADYTELLNCIRMWIAKFDASIDLTKMCIK